MTSSRAATSCSMTVSAPARSRAVSTSSSRLKSVRGHERDGLFRMTAERSADPAEPLIGGGGELLERAIAQLPQSRRREAQERERSRLVGHRARHALDELVVLERVADAARRLGQDASKI